MTNLARRTGGARELVAPLGKPVLREERGAAPAPRARRELSEPGRFHQREELVRAGERGRGIAARETELGQAFEAARELEALAVPAAVVRRTLQCGGDVELAQAQPGDGEVGLDARA